MESVNGVDYSARNGAGPGAGETTRRVYVASPLGFSAATRLYYDEYFLPTLRETGWEILDPWSDEGGKFAAALGRGAAETNPADRREKLAGVDAALGERNVALIRSADAVVAVLDGTDVDSGTASEIGYAFALDIPILGIRTDFRRTGENDGCTVNLQVEYFIRASGGSIVDEVADLTSLLLRLAPRPTVAST